MQSFKIVTVSDKIPTQDYYCYHEFIKSCGKHEPIILGKEPNSFKGLGSKPKLLYKAIKDKTINTKQIIFCDSWDLVLAAEPIELLLCVDAYKADLIISAEKNCFPSDLKEEYDNLKGFKGSYGYLNSGMIIGSVEALLATLEAMDLDNVPDDYYDAEKGCNVHINDQFLFQQIFLKQTVDIKLDYHQMACNTLHQVGIDELDFSEDRIRNKETGTYPCSWHFNGNAKTEGLRDPILRHLKLL